MIPTARLNVAVDKPSSDGRYWGRYPAGNAPIQGAQLSGNAPLFIAAGGSIITAIKLAGAPLVAAAVSGALSTQIRLAGGAAAAAIGSGTLAGVTGPGSPPTKAGNVGTPLSVDLDTIFQNAQSYTLVGNPLPTAISMSGGLRNHLISGTPSTVQSVSPTIRARDTQGYTTNFSLTENLSEGNTWVNNGGGSWTPCVTTPGLCCGTNGANNAFDDSDAHYPGCGTDYTIIAKIHRAASIPAGETHEVHHVTLQLPEA
jgi:hypothetical protein